MNGIGNDYIFIWEDPSITNYAAMAKELSSRQYAIGSDGLVVITKAEDCYGMRIFNADGTEATMCGNAIRCVARLLFDSGYIQEEVDITTLSGKKHISIESENGIFKKATVDMGVPQIKAVHTQLAGAEGIAITEVDIGNPHGVFVCNELDDGAIELAKSISTHKAFSNGINAEAVVVIDKNNVAMRVWERGSGETLACGTGASAVMYACYKSGLISETCTVHLKGGQLKIKYKQGHIYMSGTAEYNYKGTLEKQYG